jgi:hypothetical protein
MPDPNLNINLQILYTTYIGKLNSPMWIQFTSTTQSFYLPNFSYYINLYKENRFLDNPSFIGKYKILPSISYNPPSDIDYSNGVIDISRMLKDEYNGYTFPIYIQSVNPTLDDNCIKPFRYSGGFEFNPNYRFINTFSYSYYTVDTSLPSIYGTFSYVDGSGQNYILHSNDSPQFPAYPSGTIIRISNSSVNNGVYVVDTSSTNILYIAFPPLANGTDTDGDTLIEPVIYNGKFLGLQFDGNSPLLNDGYEIVNISMDNKSQNSSYNGLCHILVNNAINATQSYTNIPYGIIPESPETGTINFYQSGANAGLFLNSSGYGIKGSQQYYYDNSNLVLNYKFLSTNYSGTKSIFLNQYETISITNYSLSFNGTHSYDGLNLSINTYDINRNLLNNYIANNFYNGPTQSYIKYEFGAGTKNLQGWTISGTPINLPTLGYYDIYFTSNDGTPYDNPFTYSIINNCSPYENVRIQFLNRQGGYDYWNFNYDSKYTINIKRSQYQKNLDWNYNIGDRGRTILNTDSNTMVVANTDWINESDYTFLQELTTSQDVYVINEITNERFPINIEDTSWQQKTQLRDKLFIMTISFKYAYDINLQGS